MSVHCTCTILFHQRSPNGGPIYRIRIPFLLSPCVFLRLDVRPQALEFSLNVRTDGKGKFKPIKFSSRSGTPGFYRGCMRGRWTMQMTYTASFLSHRIDCWIEFMPEIPLRVLLHSSYTLLSFFSLPHFISCHVRFRSSLLTELHRLLAVLSPPSPPSSSSPLPLPSDLVAVFCYAPSTHAWIHQVRGVLCACERGMHLACSPWYLMLSERGLRCQTASAGHGELALVLNSLWHQL